MKHYFLTISLLLYFGLLNAQAQRTIMLTEEEYLALRNKADNPSCPTAKEQRGDAKNGFTLQLGGGIQYLYGAENADNQSFSGDFLDWYALGMLGYVFNDDKRGPGTALGLFVHTGNNNGNAVRKLLEDGMTGRSADDTEDENRYYHAEAGMVILETVRLSSGLGVQEFVRPDGEQKRLDYYSSTIGLRFGSQNFKFTLDVNAMYGRDLSETIFRPMTGLLLRL